MEDIYNDIERYLDDEMNSEERTLFEQRCKNDSEFNNQFEAVKTVRTSLGQYWAQEDAENTLQAKLAELGSQHFKAEQIEKKPTIERKIGGRFWALAAALLLLLGAIFVFFPKGEKDLYASYRDFPNANFTLRSSSSDAALEAAQKAFNDGDYPNSIQFFTDYLKENPDDTEMQFFKGLALMETESYEKANQIFNQILEKNTVWSTQAEWYMTLNDVKNGKIIEAKNRLESFPPTHEYYEKSQQLLLDLND